MSKNKLLSDKPYNGKGLWRSEFWLFTVDFLSSKRLTGSYDDGNCRIINIFDRERQNAEL